MAREAGRARRARPREGLTLESRAVERLAHVRALLAKGDQPAAVEAARAAKERLMARAARIKDPDWRSMFLTKVADSRDTLAVAESLRA